MSKARTSLPRRLLEYTSTQDYSLYSYIDQAVWRYVMKISIPFFKKNAQKSYTEGIKKVGIPINHIPKIDDMDKKLDEFGWGAISVKGFIPPIIFMEFLARRVLPIAVDIRTSNHITYTPAPDIIHEAAGHAPIIANEDYAEYLRCYGEVAKKAIESKSDTKQYEVVRDLSVSKENPNINPKILKKIEYEFETISNQKSWLSESSELARMNWWTIEYGLVGDLTNPKIYGAGLLSSVSESVSCLKNNVKKIPISLDCIKQDYNITKPQPQLFVTESFKNLKNILTEYSSTMAYVTGGKPAVEKAILSENTTTTVFDSGLQVSGILNKCIYDKKNQPSYLNYLGRIQLCYNNSIIDDHGTQTHPAGYGAALGNIVPLNKSLYELSDEELKTINVEPGKHSTIKFYNGLIVSGTIKSIIRYENKPILITLDNVSVRLEDNILFEPAWGQYDLACGNKIVSIYGGPGDWNYYQNLEPTKKKNSYHSSNLTENTEYLNKLYGKVEKLRNEKASSEDYITILKIVYNEYDKEWLLCMIIYEIIYKDQTIRKEVQFLKNHLITFKSDLQLKNAIERGLQLIEKDLSL
ncbi:MAG: aromatic amino acid hydroxylase [Candidatus Neomarinimicrobiota bacterium]